MLRCCFFSLAPARRGRPPMVMLPRHQAQLIVLRPSRSLRTRSNSRRTGVMSKVGRPPLALLRHQSQPGRKHRRASSTASSSRRSAAIARTNSGDSIGRGDAAIDSGQPLVMPRFSPSYVVKNVMPIRSRFQHPVDFLSSTEPLMLTQEEKEAVAAEKANVLALKEDAKAIAARFARELETRKAKAGGWKVPKEKTLSSPSPKSNTATRPKKSTSIKRSHRKYSVTSKASKPLSGRHQQCNTSRKANRNAGTARRTTRRLRTHAASSSSAPTQLRAQRRGAKKHRVPQKYKVLHVPKHLASSSLRRGPRSATALIHAAARVSTPKTRLSTPRHISLPHPKSRGRPPIRRNASSARR